MRSTILTYIQSDILLSVSNGKEFYQNFIGLSREIVQKHEPIVKDAVYDTLDLPAVPYKNSDEFYRREFYPAPLASFFGLGHLRRSQTGRRIYPSPANCPSFVDFPRFVGKFQYLNSLTLWEKIFDKLPKDLLNLDKLAASLGAPDINIAYPIHVGNSQLFNPWLVYLGAGTIYGRHLDNITTDVEKSLKGYLGAVKSTQHFDLVRGPNELRARLIELLGTNENPGFALEASEKEMKGCPAPLLTRAIMGSFGEYVQNDSGWESFANQVFR